LAAPTTKKFGSGIDVEINGERQTPSHVPNYEEATLANGLPNLIIAGVAKAGTTSLYHYLAQHAEICASDVKELNYFGAEEGLPPVDAYSRHFQGCAGQPYLMEASPSYCYQGEAVIEPMRHALERPRVIISLRDPVTRFWSAFTFLRSMGRRDTDLGIHPYIDRCLARPPTDPSPLSVGRYIDWLPAWFDSFGPDLQLVFAEHMFSSPQRTVDGILSWLDLGREVVVDQQTHNETAEARSHSVARLAYTAGRMSDRALARWPRAKGLLRTTYRRFNTRRLSDAMPEDVRARLTGYYAGPTRELSRYLTDRGVTDRPSWAN
jgi:hypothetical protein